MLVMIRGFWHWIPFLLNFGGKVRKLRITSSEDYVKRAVSIYLKGVACRSYIKSSEIRMSVYPGPDGKPGFL